MYSWHRGSVASSITSFPVETNGRTTMDAKARAQEYFNSAQSSLLSLSHRIHAHPELGFEEEKSASWVAESLANAGFSVEQGVCDLPTAFIARAGSGPLHIAICAEYDAL